MKNSARLFEEGSNSITCKCTNQLRWKKIKENVDEYTYREKLELQQKWVDDKGGEHWREIETVE